MRLYRVVEASDALSELEQLYPLDKDIISLIDYVNAYDEEFRDRAATARRRRIAFEFYISGEFPDGVSDDEFAGFCMTHVKEIKEYVK